MGQSNSLLVAGLDPLIDVFILRNAFLPLFDQGGFALDMRVNVDDYDEGVSYFAARGYAIFGTAHETESSKTVLMTKGDGSYLVIFHHKK